MDLADPTIAMQVRPYGSAGMANPFEMMGQFANAQRSMVEAATARQMLLARQQAGQIMSQAKNYQSGLEALRANPLTAGFAADLAQTYQGVSASQTEQAGAQQTQAQQALAALMKTIGATALSDPTGKATNAAVQAQLGTFSPTARASAQSAWQSLRHGLFDNLDPNDPNWPDQYKKNAAAFGLAGGLDADTTMKLSGALPRQMTMQPNAQAGGAMQPMVSGSPDLTSSPTAQFVGAPAGQVPTGLTPAEQQSATKKGEVAGNIASDMAESMAALPNELKKMDIMYDTMKRVGTGGGQELRSSVAQSMQALQRLGIPGIDDATIKKINDGDLDATQTFKQEIQQVLVSQLKYAQAGLGRASAMELNNQIQSLTADSDPRTIMTILNQIKYGMQVQYDKAKLYNKFQEQRQIPGTPESQYPEDQFNTYYLDHMVHDQLPTQTEGGADLAPKPMTETKSGVPKSNTDKLKSIFGE